MGRLAVVPQTISPHSAPWHSNAYGSPKILDPLCGQKINLSPQALRKAKLVIIIFYSCIYLQKKHLAPPVYGS